MPLNDRALDLMARQHVVISRPQAIACGNSPDAVDGHVKRGTLVTLYCGVYTQPGVPMTPQMLAMAAVLRCRPSAWLTGPFVLGLFDLAGFDVDDPFRVLVPPNRRVQNVPFGVVRTHVPRIVRARSGPFPIVRPNRVLIDSATMLSERRLLAAIDAARWKGLTTEVALTAFAEQLPNHPGAATIRRLARDGTLLQESTAERDLGHILLPYYPHIEWQVWVLPDARADGLLRADRVVIEYLGDEHHDSEEARREDAERDAKLTSAGYVTVYVTKNDLRNPASIIARIEAARSVGRAAGWVSPPDARGARPSGPST